MHCFCSTLCCFTIASSLCDSIAPYEHRGQLFSGKHRQQECLLRPSTTHLPICTLLEKYNYNRYHLLVRENAPFSLIVVVESFNASTYPQAPHTLIRLDWGTLPSTYPHLEFYRLDSLIWALLFVTAAAEKTVEIENLTAENRATPKHRLRAFLFSSKRSGSQYSRSGDGERYITKQLFLWCFRIFRLSLRREAHRLPLLSGKQSSFRGSGRWSAFSRQSFQYEWNVVSDAPEQTKELRRLIYIDEFEPDSCVSNAEFQDARKWTTVLTHGVTLQVFE